MRFTEYEHDYQQESTSFPKIWADISSAIYIFYGTSEFKKNFRAGTIPAPFKNDFGSSIFRSDGFRWSLLMHSITDASCYNFAIDIRRYPDLTQTGIPNPLSESYSYFGANYSTYKNGLPGGNAVFVGQFTDGRLEQITKHQQIRTNLRDMLIPLRQK